MATKTSAPKKTKKAVAATGAEAVAVGAKKRLQGTVVKAAMVGTITVKVDRFVKHPKYKKYYSVGKKFLVDDKEGAGKVGDVVMIEETRPLSKLKRFRLLSVISKAKGVEVDADGL
jgi:small subunit ribosomal protein S17